MDMMQIVKQLLDALWALAGVAHVEEVDAVAALKDSAQWTALDLMGHRHFVGIVSKVRRYGTDMLQLDALQEDGTFVRSYHAGVAVYSERAITEEEARRSFLPNSYAACDAFVPSKILPARCEDCGFTAAEHPKDAELDPTPNEMARIEAEAAEQPEKPATTDPHDRFDEQPPPGMTPVAPDGPFAGEPIGDLPASTESRPARGTYNVRTSGTEEWRQIEVRDSSAASIIYIEDGERGMMSFSDWANLEARKVAGS